MCCQWFLGKGVGCGRACREVRQWGSKPEQTQDGRRGWLPKVALAQATSSSYHRQYKAVDQEGRTEEPSAIRIARAEMLSPGTAGHR